MIAADFFLSNKQLQLKFEQLSNVMSVTQAPAVETVGIFFFQWYGSLHRSQTHQMTNHAISETPAAFLWKEIESAEMLQHYTQYT